MFFVRPKIAWKSPRRIHVKPGDRYGFMTVLQEVGPVLREGSGKLMMSKVRCDLCGKVFLIGNSVLVRGAVKSCGCWHRLWNRTHGASYSRLYKIWTGMYSRCYCKRGGSYKRYGGRGIRMCDEWKSSFVAFQNWAMNNGYEDGLTIDRIDVNGNYEPKNCRWATKKEQGNNRGNNRIIKFNGVARTLSEWADSLGMNVCTLSSRLKRMSIARAFAQSVKSKKKYSYNGVTQSISKWADSLGVSRAIIDKRMSSGMSFEEAVSKPFRKAQKIVYNGETKTIEEWAGIFGLTTQVIYKRLRLGWKLDDVFNKKTFSPRTLEYEGVVKPISEWASEFGLSWAVLNGRLKSGWDVERALKTPARKYLEIRT